MEPPVQIPCSGNCLVHLHSGAGESWLRRHACPFEQHLGPDGISRFRVGLGNNEPTFHSAHEIYTFHFQTNIAEFERLYGSRVQNVVAIIPASMNPDQYQSQLSAAADAAGVRIVFFIERSVLAATYYESQLSASMTPHQYQSLLSAATPGRRTILVFELGGHILEISLLTEDQVLNIRAAVSDLGCPLLNYMVEVLPRRFGSGFTFDADTLHHIRTECERAKDALCLGSPTVEAKFQRLGMEVKIPIDREWLVQSNLQHLRSGIMRCLTEAGVRKEDVNEVVLAGASSNMPEVLNVLLKFFTMRSFRWEIDPANLISLSSKQYMDIVSNIMNINVAALVGFNWGLYSL